jgi:MFS family permease
MILLGICDNFVILVLAAVFQGIGHSSSFSTLYAMSSKGIKSERKGRAMATAMIGFDLGAGAGAFVLGLFVSFTGYAMLFIGAAFLCAIGIAYYLIICKSSDNGQG